MKTLWIVVFILFLGSTAHARMTIAEIEKAAMSTANGQNVNDGAHLEEQYKISNRDGRWNCQDRAEVALGYAMENHYLAFPVTIWRDKSKTKGHRYVMIWDDNDVRHDIMYIDYAKEQREKDKQMIRQELRNIIRG